MQKEKQKLLNLARPHYSESECARLETAIDLAVTRHDGQKRKSGQEYVTHPLAVSSILIDWGMDNDTIIAGVLHDTIEDTDTTEQELRDIFGDSVAFLVDGVTKVSRARAGMQNLDTYLPQTTDNLSKLLIAVGQDIRVIIIKLADRLHNLQTLQHMKPKKQIKIARESLNVFAPMADRLGMGRVRVQIEEISFSYLDKKEFYHLQTTVKKRLGRSTRKLGGVRLEVEAALEKHHIAAEINGRVKSIYSLYKKLRKVDGNIDDIYDLMALRIIVDTNDDCYRVLGLIHAMYQPMINRIKDYIAVPKPNGYQSLHTTVITPNKQIVEFQVRTKVMHDYAERGLAASFHYNAQKLTKEYGRKKSTNAAPELQWIAQLQEISQRLRSGASITHDELGIDLFGDRIFVYSPKGDIFNLPDGALPLDFAYLVHSDVAKHAYSFKVNGNIHAFDKPLPNGAIVEVVTRKLAQPKPAWLELVKTGHAREKLRAQLKALGIIGTVTQAASIIQQKTLNKVNKKKSVDNK